MDFVNVTKNYRADRKLSLESFAVSLSEKLPEYTSKQTIKNWEDGKHKPSVYYLLTIALTYSDWRRDFALDGLAAIKPELYASDPQHPY